MFTSPTARLAAVAWQGFQCYSGKTAKTAKTAKQQKVLNPRRRVDKSARRRYNDYDYFGILAGFWQFWISEKGFQRVLMPETPSKEFVKNRDISADFGRFRFEEKFSEVFVVKKSIEKIQKE